jgi:uncharacterized protein YjbI with pentapeptide repeats
MTRLAVVAAVVLVAVLGGVGLDRIGDDPEPSAASAEAEHISWLFSHSADGARLEPAAGADRYTLVLDGVDAHTIMFSDRPVRDTRVLDTSSFVESWDSAFGDDPPNAVIVEHEPDGAADSIVAVLEDPELNGRTLTYRVRLLADENHPERLSAVTGVAHGEPPTEMAAVSVFIDDVSAPCDTGAEHLDCMYADLAGVSLAGRDLTDAFLLGANLRGADLHGAVLDGAFLASADLTDANLSGVSAPSASFSDANLTRTSFVGAVLDDASMIDTTISGTSFRDASLVGVTFADARIGPVDIAGATIRSVSFEGSSPVGAVNGDASTVLEDLETLGFTYCPGTWYFVDLAPTADDAIGHVNVGGIGFNRYPCP